MFTPKLADRHSGFGLIELLITIVIVGIVLVGILTVQARANLMSADPQLRKQALAIAEGLLEEISLARFTWCDPTDANAENAANPAGCATLPELVGQEAGGVARPFDNVNDYVSAYGTPTTYTTDAAGFSFPSGYSATVSISPDANLGPAGAVITPVDATAANAKVLRITVSVSYPNSVNPLVLDGYRTRYAPIALP